MDNCYCAATELLFGGDTICAYCGSLDGYDAVVRFFPLLASLSALFGVAIGGSITILTHFTA